MYHIELEKAFSRSFKKLPRNIQERVGKAIDLLAYNPRAEGCDKLQGGKGLGLYRKRVGDYRIIYSIQDKKFLVILLHVGHRREVYNSLH